MNTVEQQHCQSIVNPQPAVVGPHLHWNGGYYQVCPLAEWCPQPSCHAATPEDIRESRRRQSAELEAWREEYGEYTLVPPPDWQPTSLLHTPRRRASLVLGRLARAVDRLAFRIGPRPPKGNDIRAGRYPGAADLLSQEELS